MLAVLVAAGVWRAREGDSPPEPTAAAGSDSAAEAALRAAAMRWLAPAAPATQAAASPASAVAAAEADEAACPAAWRELAGQPADAIDRVFRRLQPQALGRAAARLSASADPYERIAGQLLATRARQPDEPPPVEAMLALVSEALASPDPRVASLAVQLCASTRFDAAAPCSSISPQRWAAVDPGNLQAWLTLAAHAQDQGDVATVREAMARAAQSGQSWDAGNEMMRLAASPTLQTLDPIDRSVLVLDMANANTALSLAGSFAMARLCPADSMGPLRLAQCGAIAELLLDRSQTLMEQGIGITIGRRVGWDAERIAALEQEHRAMMEAYGQATVFWPEEPKRAMTRDEACAIYRRVDAIVQMVTTDSELGVARRALQAARAASAAAASR
jgi:hypothetical protein